MKPNKTILKAMLYTFGALAVINNVRAARPARDFLLR